MSGQTSSALRYASCTLFSGVNKDRSPFFIATTTDINFDTIMKDVGFAVLLLFQPVTVEFSSLVFLLMVLSMSRHRRSDNTSTSPNASMRLGVLRNRSLTTSGSFKNPKFF